MCIGMKCTLLETAFTTVMIASCLENSGSSTTKSILSIFYYASRMVVKQEVKPSQMQGPIGLTTVKFLGCHEILEVLVVGQDLYQMGCSFQEVPLLF